MLRYVAAESAAGRSVNRQRLAAWLAAQYHLRGRKASATYAWVPVQLGLLRKGPDGSVMLTPDGTAYAETGDGFVVGRLLVQRIAGVADLVARIYPDRSASVAELHPRLGVQHGWRTTYQTSYRLKWLESAGLVRRVGRSSYTLTESGRSLAEELGLTFTATAITQTVKSTSGERGRGMKADVSGAFSLLLTEMRAALDEAREQSAETSRRGDYAAARQLLLGCERLEALLGEAEAMEERWNGDLAPSLSSGGTRSARRAARERPTRKRVRRKRLPRGVRTPPEFFVVPILRALRGLGGRAQTREVLERVHELVREELKPEDTEPVGSTYPTPRWRNAATWSQSQMVKQGLLAGDSPRGVWAITQKGIKYLGQRLIDPPAEEETAPQRGGAPAPRQDQNESSRESSQATEGPPVDTGDDGNPATVMNEFLRSGK